MIQELTLPKISVIMPVLNREDTLEKAIRSVLNQQYNNTELIILDGGSTDKTVEIIQRYERHLAYWHSQHDGSAAIATNTGIEKATGEIVALLMADDWYEPGTFFKISETFKTNPDADMVTCAGRIVFYDEKTRVYKTLASYTTPRELRLTFYNICYGASAICFRFIKKSLYERIGLYISFDNNNKHLLTNDKEFLLRATLHHATHVFVNHMGYTYLAHKESYSFGNHRSSAIRHCVEHREIAADYLTRNNLSRKQRIFFQYWHHDQSVKLIWFYLLNKDFRAAFAIWKQKIKTSRVVWPVAFVFTIGQVMLKRCMRVLRK
ncbi:MAG: glycosyltransferase [Gammaproteobacteria bacterium]|nr:glycosyltransferase [Gammaproteobacteria bacterium]MCW5583451.1 glycosyltransferase [Gammaproteobacteria bacterium]